VAPVLALSIVAPGGYSAGRSTGIGQSCDGDDSVTRLCDCVRRLGPGPMGVGPLCEVGAEGAGPFMTYSRRPTSEP
jgi:hypothetical protein